MSDHECSRKRRWEAARVVLAAWTLLVSGAGCTHVPQGRYAIDDVTIERADKVAASEIEDKIATAATPRFLGLFRGLVLDYELFDRYILERDLARIERLYRSRGYYEAHARAGRVEKTQGDHVTITVVVEEGPPVNVGNVRLDGITQLPIDDAAAVLTAVRRRLRSGKIFDEDRYQEAQENLVRALTDRGYAFAGVKGSANVDLTRHVADVILVVTAGRQARLGAVTITGLGDLPEEPVRRAVDLSEGELYSTSKLESARRAVLALGVFSDVDVEPVLADTESPTVAVNVSVVRSELAFVKVGGGVELDVIRADMHLLGGWEHKNFLGGLRHFTVDLRPGVVFYPTRIPTFQKPTELLFEGRARAELRQPGFLEARTGGILRGEFAMYPVLFPLDADTELPEFVLGYRDFNSGVGLDRKFGPLYASLFYNFQTSFPFAYGSDRDRPFKNLVIPYLDLTTTLDFRDDAIRPHSGIYLSNDLEVAGVPSAPNLLGPNSLFAKDVRIQPEVRAYVPLARRFTLAFRASAGFLFPSSYAGTFRAGMTPSTDDVQLVFSRGFFSGGPNSNRGYPYRGVGPKDQMPFFYPSGDQSPEVSRICSADPSSPACREAVGRFCLTSPDALACKFPTGGLSLWEASVEVRFPIAGDLGGAVFCDASDVSPYRFDIRLLYPHLSCGVGLRYDTPVGPIRLETGFQLPGLQVLASTVDAREKPSDSFYAISIGIGEAF